MLKWDHWPKQRAELLAMWRLVETFCKVQYVVLGKEVWNFRIRLELKNKLKYGT